MLSRQGFGRLDRRLLLAAAAVFLLSLLSLSNIRAAGELQARMNQDYALGTARHALRTPLRLMREEELRQAVTRLMERPDLGFRFLSVRDTAGVVLVTAGQFENLSLPILSAQVLQDLRDWLYELTGDRGHGVVMDEGNPIGSFDYAISNNVVNHVHDAAVDRLLWCGWLGLLAGLPLLGWLGYTLWRQASTALSPQLIERVPGVDWARPSPSRESAGDMDAQTTHAFRQRAGAALDQLRYALIISDRDGRVRFLNKTAEMLTGWPLADAHQRLVYSVFHARDENNAPLASAAEQCLKQGRETPELECRLRARSGDLTPIEMMASVLHDAKGEVDGVAMLFRDIGPRYRRIQELKRQSRLSQGVIDHLEEGLLATDNAGVVRFANARALRMFGYAREELDGVNVTRLMLVPFLNSPAMKLTDFAGAGGAQKLPKVVGWRKDATTFPLELQVQLMSMGEDSGLIVIVRDISQRLRGENLATRLGRLLDSALEEIYIFDAQSLYFLEVNRGARKNLGYSQEQLARMTPLNISAHLDEEAFHGYLDRLRSGAAEHLTYRCSHQRADGSDYPVEVRLNFSREEEPPVFMAIAVDISERLAAEEKLKHQAHHDPLTGLPNRAMLYDRLRQALLHAARSNRMVAVYFVDLDGFKQINDRYGHEVGDAILKCVSERLKSLLRGIDTVARLAGDEFVVIAQGLRSIEDMEALARKIVDSFRHRLDIPGHDISITASIGVSLFPLDEGDAETLLRHADSAMYQAKQAGRGCYRLFSADLDPDRRRRLDLEREIHSAVALDQYRLTLTPVMDAQDTVRAGLVDFYWEHLRYGCIDSNETLGAAARAGLLADLELWLICHSCANFRTSLKKGLPATPVIVSISGWQLRDPDFAVHVLSLMERFEVPARMLILALTQDGLSETREAPQQPMKQLIQRGVRFALRDFSGDSEVLNHAGGVPYDLLLLAAELPERAQADAEVARRLQRVLETACATGRQVIACNVPNAAVRTYLQGLGCAFSAGPVHATALSTQESVQWLAQHRAKPI